MAFAQGSGVSWVVAEVVGNGEAADEIGLAPGAVVARTRLMAGAS